MNLPYLIPDGKPWPRGWLLSHGMWGCCNSSCGKHPKEWRGGYIPHGAILFCPGSPVLTCIHCTPLDGLTDEETETYLELLELKAETLEDE